MATHKKSQVENAVDVKAGRRVAGDHSFGEPQDTGIFDPKKDVGVRVAVRVLAVPTWGSTCEDFVR